MTQVISKFKPIYASCFEVAHPWTKNCFNSWVDSYSQFFIYSIQLYFKIYLFTLLLKGKAPSLQDLKHTMISTLLSSNFMALHGLIYYSTICNLRYILGHFNIVSMLFMPGLFCALPIFIERQSRRILLCLYITNLAIEVFWRCLKERNIVKPLPYGRTMIFSLSIGLILMYLKDEGYNYIDEKRKPKTDNIFRFLRYILGSEEFKYKSELVENERIGITNKISAKCYSKFKIYNLYLKMINWMKSCRSHTLCPHSYSCIYYVFKGISKTVTVGAGVEILVTLLINIQKIWSKPAIMKTILFRNGFLHHTLFVTKFVSIFKTVSCILRWITNNDNKYNTLLAGFLAGLAYTNYNDNQIAIYIMLKALHITYNLGIRSNIVPEVPYFTEVLYIITSGILVGALTGKPNTVRLDYIKYFHNLSAGRSALFNRKILNQWGFNAHNEMEGIMKKLKLEYCGKSSN